MYMPEVRLIKHQQTQTCNSNTQMLWMRRDVAITSRCAEATFSVTCEDEVECIKVMDTFNYLVRILYQSGGDWMEVRQNVRKARQVWIRL